MAVFRLHDEVKRERFLKGKSPTAIYQHMEERYSGWYRVHYFHQIDLNECEMSSGDCRASFANYPTSGWG